MKTFINSLLVCTYKYNKKKIYHFRPYILGLLSIWLLYFDSSKFDPCYFQLTVNFDYIYLVNKSLISYEIINILICKFAMHIFQNEKHLSIVY